MDQYGELWERPELPWLKDPSTKFSIWSIIKDAIGKDLTKISVPVYINDPSSFLQKIAQSYEYTYLLDLAADAEDPMLRLSYLTAFMITSQTVAEKSVGKPFNPLLFETYELKTDNFDFIAEQVSHHPPVAAVHIKGKNWTVWTNQKGNISFNGKNITLTQQYRTYFELHKWNETFECIPPTFSIHNLVIGQLYVDIGSSMHFSNLQRPHEKSEIKFESRGWFSDDAFKFAGMTYVEEGPKKRNVTHTFTGKWNKNIVITDTKTKQPNTVWTKVPYPEKVDWMYGMSHFAVQLNYLPKRLKEVIAPTDTRFRPDQRALENGDMKFAEAEKNRLENRQRSFRKYHAAKNIEPKPRYFEPWDNK